MTLTPRGASDVPDETTAEPSEFPGPSYERDTVRALRAWMGGLGEHVTEAEIHEAWGDFSESLDASWLGASDDMRGCFVAYLIGQIDALTTRSAALEAENVALQAKLRGAVDPTCEPVTRDLPEGESFTSEQAAVIGRRLAERRSDLPITEHDFGSDL